MTGRMEHMTPQQSLDAAIAAGWQPVALTEAELVDEFRPHARRKVTRGTVTTRGGARYHHAELAHLEGEEVLVAEDRDDPGHVWVKDLEGRRIACAHLVAAVAPRTESMAEHSARKRAEAQIKRRERQIDDIEARIAPPAIEMLPPVPLFEAPGAVGAPRRQREPELLDPIDTFAHFEQMKRERLAREAEAARAAAEQDPATTRTTETTPK